MRSFIFGATLVLLLLPLPLLQGCSTPGGDKHGADKGDSTQPVTTETETVPKVAPKQVTGLKAVFIGTKARLTWDPIDGVFGYEIYRVKQALPSAAPAESNPPPRLAVPGTKIDMVAEPDFNDYDLAFDYEYTYRVVAVNRAGKGPASAPASITAVPFLGWYRAPPGGDYVEPYQNIDWADAIGTAGGNQGITSTTQFPVAATQYASCTGTGVALGAYRPANNALIPAALQTFLFDLNYNLTGGNYTFTFEASAANLDTSLVMPVYKESGALTGCGTKQISYTADFSGLDFQSLNERFTVYDSNGWQVFSRYQSYAFENGIWLRVMETVPAEGATLTGGTLSARIRHNRLPTLNATLQIDAGYSTPVFASLITEISGTGEFMLDLPYTTECGYPTGRLRLSTNQYDISGLTTTLSYLMSSPLSTRMRADQSELWLSPYWAAYGLEIDLNVSSCVETAVPVTITASTDWRIYRYLGTGSEISQTVTGMTNDYYQLRYMPGSPSMQYGAVTGVATAYFPSGVTRSALVRAHIFDLFWHVTPPQEAASWVSYPIEITVAGPHPPGNLSLEGWGSYGDVASNYLAWSEATNSYPGFVSFPTCGYYYLDAYSAFGNSTPYLYSIVTTGSTITLEEEYFWFDNGDLGPRSFDLTDACGQAFTWSVVYAPAWLRFQSLSGSSTTALEIGIVESEAFPTGDEYSVWGRIGIQANGAGPVFEMTVRAYR